MEHRSAIRKKSKALNANLLTAHQLAFSAVISYQDRIQGRQYEATDPSIRGRMSLIAQFVQGVDITEVAISEGLYANAANLLKQELEILVAIDEYQAGKRRDGRSPNVRNILSRFYNRYSEFNNLAHPTRQEILESLSTFSDGEHYGPTTIPRFNAELYHILYGNQAMFLVMIFARMRTVFREVFDMDWDDEETRIITSALRILVDEGIVEEQGEA
jgi:hypothetical protein